MAHFTESSRYCLQAWLDPGTQAMQRGSSLSFTVTICVWVELHWKASFGGWEQTFSKTGWGRHLHHQGQEVLVFLGSRDWAVYVSCESMVTPPWQLAVSDRRAPAAVSQVLSPPRDVWSGGGIDHLGGEESAEGLSRHCPACRSWQERDPPQNKVRSGQQGLWDPDSEAADPPGGVLPHPYPAASSSLQTILNKRDLSFHSFLNKFGL